MTLAVIPVLQLVVIPARPCFVARIKDNDLYNGTKDNATSKAKELSLLIFQKLPVNEYLFQEIACCETNQLAYEKMTGKQKKINRNIRSDKQYSWRLRQWLLRSISKLTMTSKTGIWSSFIGSKIPFIDLHLELYQVQWLHCKHWKFLKNDFALFCWWGWHNFLRSFSGNRWMKEGTNKTGQLYCFITPLMQEKCLENDNIKNNYICQDRGNGIQLWHANKKC